MVSKSRLEPSEIDHDCMGVLTGSFVEHPQSFEEKLVVLAREIPSSNHQFLGKSSTLCLTYTH